ncbi:hypothetical protein LPB86_18325 [Pedobacter sp. MC2016-14]|uniref:hypothetical protein n=1 Tax=Pedobacter sp. MC2016-14 TaxID=2897327 RepID=UPI001E467843|nr:hypothetical protein [Pedobacter sp. MC2016-14]MCD0490203.1 hypothetical protein [Pedobacter sp. MC2016-14]
MKNLKELKSRQSNLTAMHTLLQKEILTDGTHALVRRPARKRYDTAEKVVSWLIPLLVDKTLLRKSGFVTKAIGAFVVRKTVKRLAPVILSWTADALLHRKI